MKVLVTGGGGFLGSWVCRQLAARGDRVVAFQRSAAPQLAELGTELIRGDIRDSEQVAAAASGCEAIIHTAGKAGAWGEYEVYHGINVTGTENVLQACRSNGIHRLVFTSSPSVVHGGGDIEGGDESLPYPAHYEAPYPETKAMAERAVMAANDDGLLTVSLRPHLVWGPGDNQLLPRLLKRAQQGAVRLPGINKLIDTVYVENAAKAHLQALDALHDNPDCHGRTYFISNDQPMAQGEIISALLRASGCEVEIKSMSPNVARIVGRVCERLWKLMGRESEPPITAWAAEQLSTAHWYDISAVKRDLGYQPEISISEGLQRLRAANQT